MVTKLLLVPVLLALVVARMAPRIIWLWLVGCWIGDLFLLWPSTFALGMAGFALAHACLIGYFLTRGAWARLKVRPWVPVAIALLAVVVMPFVFSGVDDVQLRSGMPIYSVLLVAMAALAWSFNRTAGVGAVCFVISDSLIALGFAGRISERPAMAVVEMVLYLVAIVLLALGILHRESMAMPPRAELRSGE